MAGHIAERVPSLKAFGMEHTGVCKVNLINGGDEITSVCFGKAEVLLKTWFCG